MATIDWDENLLAKDTDDVANDLREAVIHAAKATFTGDSDIPDGTLYFNRTTKRWEEYSSGTAADISGQGEVNTASNVGGGSGFYKTKSTYDLVFKTLKRGSTRLTITANTDAITIDVGESIIVHNNLNGGNTKTGVHGATGALVDTGSSQTLTNKTLSAPDISDFTNANHSHGSASTGGQISFVNLSPRSHDHASGSGEGQVPLSNLSNRARLKEVTKVTGDHGDSLMKEVDTAPDDWTGLIIANAFDSLSATSGNWDVLYFTVPSNGFCAVVETIFTGLHTAGDNRKAARILSLVSRYNGGSVTVVELANDSGDVGLPDLVYSVFGTTTQFVARINKPTGVHSTYHHTQMRIVSVAET